MMKKKRCFRLLVKEVLLLAKLCSYFLIYERQQQVQPLTLLVIRNLPQNLAVRT